MSLLFLAVSKIDNLQVSFEAYLMSNQYACVSFDVGNSYDRGDEVKNKVAITKWLLKQWKHCLYHIEKEELIPVCEVYTGDWNIRERFKIFKKMGFTPVYGVGMVYGNNNNRIEGETLLPIPLSFCDEYCYCFFEKDSCLYESFFDKENAEYKGLLFNEKIIGEFSVRGKVWLIKWLGVDEVYKYTPLD